MTDPLEYEYPFCVKPDTLTDGSFCYVAEHPDLPGCVAYGRTLPEARNNLDFARRAYLIQLIEEGESIPTPSTNRPTSLEWQVGRPTATQDWAGDGDEFFGSVLTA